MVYTEIRAIHRKKYFYRVVSIRNKNKVSKKRVYLGFNLSKLELSKKEKNADVQLQIKKTNKEIEKIKPIIIRILKKNRVTKAGIFGSYARGTQKKNSDIDILIQPPKMMGLGFVNMKLELEKKLGRKVDLITYKYISPLLKEHILKDEVKIL